jgi:hypothetical protein
MHVWNVSLSMSNVPILSGFQPRLWCISAMSWHWLAHKCQFGIGHHYLQGIWLMSLWTHEHMHSTYGFVTLNIFDIAKTILLIVKIFEATFATKGRTIFLNMFLAPIHGIRPCHEWGFLIIIWGFFFWCKIMWVVCHVDHYIGGSYVVFRCWSANLALANVHFWQITCGNHIMFIFSPY